MDTVHPDLRMSASDAQAFYADTGCAVADVALYENEWGIVAAGAMRPGLSPEQVRRFRGSDVSPDWRMINGRLEVVGLLCVNVSGFIVQGLVASGAEVSNARGVFDSKSGEVTALVAAGMVRHADTEVDELRREVTEMRAEIDRILAAIRPIRAERAAARVVNMALSIGGKAEGAKRSCCSGDGEPSTGRCGCAAH
jgi:acetolactate synthase small subunit